MKIELHPAARAEFAAQIEYYDDEQPGLGRRFYQEVMASLERIAEHPDLVRLRKSYRRLNLKIFPFYIAYVVEDGFIWVLAVAHSKRKPGYWRKRF